MAASSRHDESKDWLIELIEAEFQDFGNITYDGGLLTVAQLASRKGYHNLTVLEPGDFQRYLYTLRDSFQSLPRPWQEKFILAGDHWLSGEIQIKEDGQVNILLLDSLGQEGLHRLKDFLNKIASAFRQSYPIYEIYLSATKRQNSPAGCSVFAIDDIQHLYPIDKYLPPSSDSVHAGYGLFDYLSHSAISEVRATRTTHCKLPLSLMRTMQSGGLEKEICSRSELEQKTPVNKKGETAKVSADKGWERTSDGKWRNIRLKNKLENIAKHNREYVEAHSCDEIDEAMKACTLEGFKNRLSAVILKGSLARGFSS